MRVEIQGINWLGLKTEKFKEMRHFYEKILGLKPIHIESYFRAYDLANGDRIEIFDSKAPYHHHFTNAPVVGFQVDNIVKTRKEMEKKGIKFIGLIEGNPNKSQWTHFRGPDGNVYELIKKNKRKK